MRVFIGMTREMLAEDDLLLRRGHAATDGLSRVMDDEEEVLEAVAMLAAADDSLRLLIADPEAEACRVVVAADVEARVVTGDLPTEVEFDQVSWSDVVAIFLDEDSAAEPIERARSGGDEEFDEVADLDMLWYDPTERLLIVGN